MACSGGDTATLQGKILKQCDSFRLKKSVTGNPSWKKI